MNPGTFESFATAALLLADKLYNNPTEQFPVDVDVRIERQLKASRNPETLTMEVSGSCFVAIVEDCTINHDTYILCSSAADTEEEAIQGLLKILAQRAAAVGIKMEAA